MYSSSAIFLILAAAIALCSVDAWTATSSASSFGGKSLVASKQAVVVQNGSSMEMKKGKANVPPMMRGQYQRQREMNEMQQQMRAASMPGADGFPVFNLFVRTKTQKVCFVVVSIFRSGVEPTI